MSDAEHVGMLQAMAEMHYWLVTKTKDRFTDEESGDLTIKLYNKGVRVGDLSKEEYKDLPIDWVINLVS
jgi:hypothetical protein